MGRYLLTLKVCDRAGTDAAPLLASTLTFVCFFVFVQVGKRWMARPDFNPRDGPWSRSVQYMLGVSHNGVPVDLLDGGGASRFQGFFSV